MRGRRPLDAYYTPDELAERIVRRLPVFIGDRVLEPHVGGGAFVRALSCLDVRLTGMDIDPEAPGLAALGTRGRVGDFLAHDPCARPKWVIGNPPYRDAIEHIIHARAVSSRHVVFLLRLAFLESQRRAEFWHENPCREVWVLSRRPSFTGGGRGTDSCAYGVFWWDRDCTGSTILEVI